MDDHISPENREKLLSLAHRYRRSLAFLGMNNISESLNALGAPKWSGSYTAYGRLFAMGMIQEKLDRLLYLDSDTIVTADLSGAYHTALEENICAMVQDTVPCFVYKHIGLSRTDPYFNTGVILFDVEKWKQLDYVQRFINKHSYTAAKKALHWLYQISTLPALRWLTRV